ncbi:MAG TPA: EamA family transporter [Myxococcota bacterium]|nr:EamA family transporter [Myxococcota bacterium]
MKAFDSAFTLGLLALALSTLVGRELFFKLAADQSARRGSSAAGSVARPAFWLGIVTGAAALVTWVLVLQRAPLAIAYPLFASTYAGVPVASALVFGERLSRSQVWGTGFVALGVVCVMIAGM